MSHQDDTLREEGSAFGQRVKGAAKDAAGAVTGNRSLEREGERENAEGRARQASNNVFDETDGVPGATVGEGRWVSGIYGPEAARTAYDSLADRYEYGPDDVNIAMSEATRKKYFADDSSASRAAESAGKGAGIGIGVGAALGAIVASATAIAVPGLGLVVAGPIAGAIAGAGTGAAAGTVLGAMVGSTIPKDRVADYEKAVRDGDVVMSARARDEAHAAELERDMTDYGGRQILR
jgi:uncharacterized protein YjbJ (UPF0337 family)